MKKMRTTRRSVFYAAIASLPLLLAACAEQAETPGAGSAATPITVTIATDGTRAAIDLQSVQIADGQQLLAWFPAGVTLADGTASPCTTTYAVGAANAVTPTQQPYLQAGERSAAIHLLYAPDTGTGTDSWPNGAYPTTGGTFTVKQDQSNDDNYRLSDLMYGTANAVRTDVTASAAVTMRHLMAKVVVTATAGAGISQVKAIYVVAGYRGMSVAVSNGAVTLEEANASAIDATAANRLTMLSGGTSTTATAAALLPPQTIDAGALIAVETDMGTVNYALPAARQLMPGEVSTFDVTPSRSDLGQTVTLPDAHEPAGSDTHRNRLAFHLPDGTTFNMVFVEGGRMENLHSKQATEGYTSGYNVTMSDFYMAETETTQGLWKAVMGGMVNASGAPLQSYGTDGATISSAIAGSGPGPVVSDNYPVGNIQWPHVLTLSGCFIDKLNAATIGQRPPGWEFTLPTSAQFEYAARGGLHSAGFKYAGSNTAADVIWYAENTGTAPKPVATNQPNELGLYDMQGNQFEVCSDWQPGTDAGSMTITAGEYTNPTGPASAYDSGQDKWWFGPGWNNDTGVTEGYFNYGWGATNGGPTYTDWVRGFRVALVKIKPASVGDLYFSDGTWGTLAANPGKTPIGIVVSTDLSGPDRSAGYKYGYVMALGKASTGCQWTTLTNYCDRQVPSSGYSTSANFKEVTSDMDGLTHTNTAKANASYSASAFPAVYNAVNYSVAAPAKSSGWYLPSAGQIYAMIRNLASAPELNGYGTATAKDNASGHWACWSAKTQTYLAAVNAYIKARYPSAPTLFAETTLSKTWSSTHRYQNYAWMLWGKASNGDLCIEATNSTGNDQTNGIVIPFLAF